MSYDAEIRVGTKLDNGGIKKAQQEFEKLNQKLDSLYKKGDKLESLGVDKQGKQWQSLRYDVAQVEMAVEDAKDKLLSFNGVSSTQELTKGFAKVKDSSKKCFGSLQAGTKKTGSMFQTLGTRLKGIVLSLLVFNWITKGFNAMVTAIKAGFQNLAKYSTEYNSSMSALKSSSAQLKNSLATAFEPIANVIIPYITSMVNWLNVATEAMSKFLAAMSGKTTYTKAKKQVVDYAKSLDTASKSAKGALASFDEINVLDTTDTSSTAGGETTGAAAFETGTISDDFMKKTQTFKDILDKILPVAITIGAVLLTWKVGSALSNLISMAGVLGGFVAILALIGGTVLAVVSYLDMWKTGVDWPGIIGYIAGVAIAVGAMFALLGPVAAGIVLIVAGLAGLILSIKDIIENGMNAKNMTMLLVSAVALIAGVFMIFGGTIALVVAAVMLIIAALAALIKWTGNGKEMIQTLKDTFKDFGKFLKDVFAGDWKAAWEDIKKVTADVVNMLFILIESLVNGAIKGINLLVDAINTISFDVPDGVPIIGGTKFGFNIPHVGWQLDLPRLANGGITNRATTALIGEAGREAVLPLENNTGWMDDLADRLASRIPGGTGGTTYLQIDGQTFAKLSMPYMSGENKRIGLNLKVK